MIIIKDTNTYDLLKRDPSSGYRKKVIDSLQELERSEVIDRDLYHKLYPGETVPKFYGLPKIHKENSPLRPIVSSVDSVTYNVAKHLGNITGTPPTHWYRYVDDTWVKIKVDQLVPFFDHINNVNQYIKFTQEELKDGKLAFLDCSVSIVEDGKLRTSLYRKSTHTDQYLLFESHHPLVHKLGVIRTLFHRADTICLDEDSKDSEHKPLKSALGACGYQSWTFEKALKKSKPRTLDSNSNRTQGGESRRYNTTIPYVSKLSEKIRRIYREYQLPVSFKPYNTLRQKLVHSKDKTPKDKQNNIVYGFRCQDNGCEETYIGETKQTLGIRMYQHRRASTSGCGDSAVYSHLNSANHSFDNKDVIILDRESRWFERGVKEALYVKREQPSLNKGGGLRHNLAGAYSSEDPSTSQEFVDPVHGSITLFTANPSDGQKMHPGKCVKRHHC